MSILQRILLPLLFTCALQASLSSKHEQEPNDLAVNATVFRGETSLHGELKKEDTDHFLWKISKKDTLRTWEMAVSPSPQGSVTVTVSKVVFQKAGLSTVSFSKNAKELKSKTEIFRFSNDSGHATKTLNALILQKGMYLIAIKANQKTSYKVDFTKKEKIHHRVGKSKKTAQSSYLNGRYAYTSKDKNAWLKFKITKKENNKTWQIQSSVTLAATQSMFLYNEHNEVIAKVDADTYGKMYVEDLEFSEGVYYIHYPESTDRNYMLEIKSTGTQTIDKNEIEPNNSVKDANTVSLNKIIHGSVGSKKDTRDYFTFRVPSDFKHKVFDMHINSLDKALKVSLSKNNKTLQVKSADSNYTFSALSLQPKQTYYVEVYKYAKDANYSISFSKPYGAPQNTEIEPNDTPKNAPMIEHNQSSYGHLTGTEMDCFTFKVDHNNLFWSIQTKGDTLQRLSLYHKDHEILRTQEHIDKTLRFENLFLSKSTYALCIQGKNGNYQTSISYKSMKDLNISSLADFEHEPNQHSAAANHLSFNKPKQGLLETINNEDFFYFTLKNEEHIRLTATPPKDGDVRIKLISDQLTQRAYPKLGNASVIEGIYPAGRYTVELFTDKPSFNTYSLTLDRLDPFRSTDMEPNNIYAQAGQISYTQNIKGHTSSGDIDTYTLPRDLNESNITIEGKNLKDNIRIYPHSKGYALPLVWDDTNQSYSTALKTPQTSYIYVESGIGAYDYKINFSHYNNKPSVPLDASFTIDKPQTHPRSYYHLGQILDFNLVVQNGLPEEQTLYVELHSSNAQWKVHCDKESITLLAKEEKSIACQVVIPKNVSTKDVVLSLKIDNHKGGFQSSRFTLSPNDDASPLSSFKDWNMPKSLLGTLNVAYENLGAKRILEHKETSLGYVPNIGKNYHSLFDDIVYGSYGFYLTSGRKVKDENVSVELLSDALVTGVALNLKSYDNPQRFLKDFSIWLSKDGVAYTKVYTGSLKKSFEEQFFKFNKLHNARYAKLTLHNNQENSTLGVITLGTWKVLAKQEVLNTSHPFNIANPKLGGHVVSASKTISQDWDNYVLTKKEDIPKFYFDKEEKNLNWVIGFKHGRMATITHMLWKEAKKSNPNTRFGNVDIYVSTQTPTGPWEKVKIWERNASLEKNASDYVFNAPTWARYIKFSIDVNKSGYSNAYYPPESLEIFEEKPSNTYKSILGEWGNKSHESYYEYMRLQQETKNAPIKGNEEKTTAHPLDENTSIYGEVSVAKHQKDWYKISVPKGQNTLTLTLENHESVDVSYVLYDTNHTVIKEQSYEHLPQVHTMTFPVSEGVYYLNIHQPPVNVVFAWDNSGSVSPYKKQIAAAVNGYVNQIEENIDNVNLLCFNRGNRFVLSDFSNKKEEIQTIFHDFDWSCQSSDAEISLSVATQALKTKKGIKGVIVIADAEGSRQKDLWEHLEEVRPKVFSVRVASRYDSRLYENAMQSWSRINNGTYAVVENATEMSQAINHAAHVLRRPVFYNVKMHTNYVRPLADGTLRVISPKPTKVEKKKKVDKSFAIELILDASGSMLKRIKGKRRIEIAKDVLTKAVQEIIPPNTLVALRVFGHKKADSCRTDLEMRLQTLNVKKTSGIIKRIKAKNLAKTPIAASLAKVASDLKTVKGKRVIILVTDGKETCEGNATKEIEKLKALGIEVRLNIVGFAIDDKALKKEFEAWAKLGNGEYFEADDKKSLDAAVKKALQVPYSIYNQENKLLFKGMVGDNGTKLKGGIYKVMVESYPKKTFNTVEVIGEKTTELNLYSEGENK